MDKIKIKAEELNRKLLELEVVQEYQKYEEIIKSNEELKFLENRIKELQKKIVRQKADQDEDVVTTIKEYKKIKNNFETHPIVVNYLYLQQEVDMLLQHINTRINGELSNQDLTK